jgi:hypothetical protein
MKQLTISQALRRRKKLKGDIALHTERLRHSISYDKKKEPAFPFTESNLALKKAKWELIMLEDAVAFSNAINRITYKGEQVRLTWVLRVLAELKGDIVRYEGYKSMHDLGVEREVTTEEEISDPYSIEEIPRAGGGVTRSHKTKKVNRTIVSNVTARECEDQIATLKQSFEELNDLLEAENHLARLEYEDQYPEGDGSGKAAAA